VFPILGIECVGLTLLIIISSISTVCGIGGGGLVIPFCMTFLGFSTKNAIALSGFTIFSCAVVRFLFFLNHKHPEKDAVLIDYDLASIMLPIVMAGSMIGALASITLPNLILQILLTILMVSLTILTGLKGRSIYQKENMRLAVIRAREMQLSGDEFDEEEYRRFMEQSQPSIFEIVLEDLLILKGQNEKAALNYSIR
jgi:uncharacterized membrane protein YfcA